MFRNNPLGPKERRRRRKYFKMTGVPGRLDNTELRAHLAKLTQHLSIAEIARRSGVPEGTIWYQVNTDQRACYIPTLQALAKVQLQPSDLEKLTHEQYMWGSYRIVQGLAALGWTGPAIGEACGLTVHMVRAMGRTPRPQYLNQTGDQSYRALLLGAQKLERQHPVRDGGISERVYKTTKKRAATRGSPPLGCWDLDTVHLPESEPEWTGACGTEAGRRIHRREKIPMCQRCRDAEVVLDAREPGVFSPVKFRKVREKVGLSQDKLDRRIGFAEGTVRRWETGRSTPRARNLERALSVLGVTFEDVSGSED